MPFSFESSNQEIKHLRTKKLKVYPLFRGLRIGANMLVILAQSTPILLYTEGLVSLSTVIAEHSSSY